jgi:hypothetical protein
MTEIAGLEVRSPTSDDVPAIGELYRIVKGRPRPESVTRHRLFDTPWGDSVSLIALADDLCAGIVVFWPVMMSVGGELMLGAQGMEAVTHPDYRRPRLFVGMARSGRDMTRDQGIELLYTFPNARSIKLTKHVRATYLGDVHAYGVETARGRLSMPWRRRTRAAGFAVEEPGGDELRLLISQAHADSAVVRVDKSDAWLRWRYSASTCERYEWLTLRDADEQLTAAALLGERDPESWGEDFEGIVRVHELFALDEAAGRALLASAVAHVQENGGRKLDILVKDPVLERAAEGAGMAREAPHPMTAYRHEATRLSVDTFDFARWRLVSGDMDFF